MEALEVVGIPLVLVAKVFETALALGLLVLADRHRQDEETDGFAAGFAMRFGAPNWLAASGPNAALLVVLLGVAAGFLGYPAGFALAAGFVAADKLFVHQLYEIPGDSGWWAFCLAAALYSLEGCLVGLEVAGAYLAGGLLLLGYVALSALLGAVWRKLHS